MSQSDFIAKAKALNSGQQSQLTALLAATAVCAAFKRGTISEPQATDILNAAAFACHVLSTFATLEALANSAACEDAPPIEIVLMQFTRDTHAQVRPALDKLQNLLDMLKPAQKETTSS